MANRSGELRFFTSPTARLSAFDICYGFCKGCLLLTPWVHVCSSVAIFASREAPALFANARFSDYPVPMAKICCKALLFDMDGVLIDSTPVVTRVWSEWARRHGFDPDEIVRRVHGRPSIATIRELLPTADHEAENREVERREILDLDGVIPMPGVRGLLASLPPDRWTIVTSGTRPLANARIRAAGLSAPGRFITAQDIVNGKPDPEPYLKGAALLGFAPQDCVVVEDAAAGVHSGKAAGARVVAVQTTETNDVLIELGADWIVKDCGSLSVDGSCLVAGTEERDLVINATPSGRQPEGSR